MSKSSIGAINRTLSGATTSGQNGSRSSGNEGVGTLHSLKFQHYWSLIIRWFNVILTTLIGGESYLSTGLQSVYFTGPANWALQQLKQRLRLKSKYISE